MSDLSHTVETKPNPDPTLASNDAIERAAVAERDYVNGQLDVLRERLKGIDVATQLLNSTVNRTPTDIQKEILHLRELSDEKFESVAIQFKERDTRQERESRDNKVAVDAAFAAQKEAACVSADTMVLCADLIWRPAGELQIGDELVAFDEESPVVIASSGRRYQKAVVTANESKKDTLYRVATPLGFVDCNPEHPWLVRRHIGHKWEWRQTKDLRLGDTVMQVVDVWDVDRSYGAGWLAGILDGEGCLTFKSRRNGGGKVSIGQVDGIIADAIDEALEAQNMGIVRHTRPVILKAQAQRRWEINGRADILRLLGSIRPARLLAHSDEVWVGFAIRGQDRMTTVTSIDDTGVGTIAALSTSTKTYIAGGFAMHNSEQNKSNNLAIDKSEKATGETLSKQADLFKSTTDGLSSRIAELKERLDRGEGSDTGMQNSNLERRVARNSSNSNITLVLFGVSVFLSLASLITAILLHH
jgi:hypothetical protein